MAQLHKVELTNLCKNWEYRMRLCLELHINRFLIVTNICASNAFVTGQPRIFVESAADTRTTTERKWKRKSISHPNEWDELLAGVFIRAVEVKQEGIVSTGLTGRVMLSCQWGRMVCEMRVKSSGCGGWEWGCQIRYCDTEWCPLIDRVLWDHSECEGSCHERTLG